MLFLWADMSAIPVDSRDPRDLHDHPLNKTIYGIADDLAFAARVRADGAITSPLHILPDNTVISGHRRKHAAIACGFPAVPVIVRYDLLDDLDIELCLVRSNDQREKTNEHKIREYLAVLKVEQEKAKRRMLSGVKASLGDVVGSASSLAAEQSGLGKRKTCEKGAAVIKAIGDAVAANRHADAAILRQYLHKSVHQAHKLLAAPLKKVDEFGPALDFHGLRHEPINELGVVFLFGMVAEQLGFAVEAIRAPFPDCIAKRRKDNKGNSGRLQSVRIEFEFRSSNFKAHKHDAAECDLLVCWTHDWPECPIEVLELATAIKLLPHS